MGENSALFFPTQSHAREVMFHAVFGNKESDRGELMKNTSCLNNQL